MLVVGVHGATSIRPEAGFDGAAHVDYADVLEREDRLPVEEESYEFHSPPLFHWIAVRAQGWVDRVGGTAEAIAGGAFDVSARAGWLAIAAILALLALMSRRRGRLWLATLVLAGGALLWLGAALVATATETRWSAGQLLSVLWTCGLVAVAWLLGRLLWPGRADLPLIVALGTFAIPIVPRLGTMFHPEMQFAFLAAAAILVFLRAHASGWPLGHGVALGALLGLAALTRQTAVVVILGLGIAAFLLGRAAAWRFAATTAALVLLLAGPWWFHQFDRHGNPIQSNLDREGYLLEGGQPRSFYVSFPVRDLVVHPYRPSFQNELLPQFHADLWSDWFGGQHGFWGDASRSARFFASTQSVLGVFAAVVALAGLVGVGLPAVVAAARGRRLGAGEAVFATFLVLAILTWAAFVVTLIRFPQAEGDPIKSSYMLYLTPALVVAAVAFVERLWRKGTAWQAAALAWSALYAVSYAGFLATSW